MVIRFLIIVGMMFAASAANAFEGVYEGEVVKITQTILCDSAFQLVDIIKAREISKSKGNKVYEKWHKTVNLFNEPTCLALVSSAYFVVVGKTVEAISDPVHPIAIYYVITVYYGRIDGTINRGFIISSKPSFPKETEEKKGEKI